MFPKYSRILLKNPIIRKYSQSAIKPKRLEIKNTALFDLEYLCNQNNVEEIEKNISIRKGVGNIRSVIELNEKLNNSAGDNENYDAISKQLHEELLRIPNKTHPDVREYGDTPKIVKEVGELRKFDVEPKEFQEITKRMKLIRTEQLGNVCGNRSYYLLGELAELEQALIRYVLNRLLNDGFKLVSVPDILPRELIERCGMHTRGQRTQVYSLDPELHGKDLCLSGTSEIALAGYLMDKQLKKDELPLKLAAVSRCYRAEVSNVQEERGIYRVHEFTKVEMFIASTPETSENMLSSILKIEEELFEELGLHFKILDMPPHELGAQAYRKYDIEAWLYGRKIYGEISSCSNCLDYQSRRLNITYKDKKSGDLKFVHTLNGTACAIPRLLIALIEMEQNKNGTINIPKVLQKYMAGKDLIKKQKQIPELKLIKNKK